MKRLIFPLLLLLLAAHGCSSTYGPEDLRSGDIKGMVLKKSRTEGSYFLHVQHAGEQTKLEVSSAAYDLVGEGDALPVSPFDEGAGAVEEVDEEAAKEGDGSEFKPTDVDDESEEEE